MYERILLPTDGSDVAAAATDAAIALAGRFDADLHVLHVLELGELPPGVEDADADEFAHRGEEAAQTAADRAAEADVAVTAAVLEAGEPVHRAIVSYAEDHDVDCVVMGTSGRTGLDRLVLGSVAERTVRDAPMPVMTVHEDTVVDSVFDSVLVPTDGSDCAQAAATHAIELATATGAALHVVHVVDIGAVVEGAGVGDVLDSLEQAGERALEWVVDRAGAAGVSTVAASVLSGAPSREIVAYADDRDVDCIVIGTHGRTGLDRYLLGSVAERVVRLADVPVLAVKDSDADD